MPGNAGKRALSEALDRLEEDKASRERYKAADEVRLRALSRIENDRVARYDELLAEAGRVLAWRDEFLRSRDARRLWALLGDDARVPLFSAPYWDGRPLDGGITVARTLVVLTGSLHQFRLEGWGPGGRRTRGRRLSQPGDLVREFHPDMLVEFRLHLEARAHEDVIAAFIEEERARHRIDGTRGTA